MGRRRHSVFLATRGWKVTGYDFSADAVASVLVLARQAGVTITAVQATHDTFDFGDERWDLIVVSHAYIDMLDSAWPTRFCRALKPRGRVVFQGGAPPGTTAETFRALWRQFEVPRLDMQDGGEDWLLGQAVCTVEVIAAKHE